MRVERDIALDASREEVWELVSEPDNYPRFWQGLTRLDRKNDEHGCGARFAMRMRVGSADIGGLIEIASSTSPPTWRGTASPASTTASAGAFARRTTAGPG